MNNIKIVNDELRKNTDKNIVFDYDGKTFFYEGSIYHNNEYCDVEIKYKEKIVLREFKQKLDWEEVEYSTASQIDKNIITRELFNELKEINFIYNIDYDDACDIGFDIFDYYTKKYDDVPNADLEKVLQLNSKYRKDYIFMFKQNNEYYFGNLIVRNPDWLVKDLSLIKYDKNLHKEFVMEFDSHAWEDKLVYGYYYYNDDLLTNEIKNILEDEFDIDFESERIKKYTLKIDSLHADNLHLDLTYQNKKYMIRKIPITINEFRYKIFDENYNLLYEEFDPNDKKKKYRGDGDIYPKEECNYKKKLHSNGFIYLFEKINFLDNLGYSGIKTRINNDFDEYPELK